MKVQISRASKVILLLISATLAAQEPSPSASVLADLKSLSHGFIIGQRRSGRNSM
jgi:hypothetical protein